MNFKTLLLALSTLLLVFISIPTTASAETFIRSEGFVTTGLTGDLCTGNQNLKDQANAYQDYMTSNYDSARSLAVEGEDEEEETFISKSFAGFIGDAIAGIARMFLSVGDDCEGAAGIGLVQQMFVLVKPITLTNVEKLMSVTALTIWIGLSAMLFSILVFAYKLIKGDEDSDPFQFAAKFISTIVLVYYAPYFIQDIVNINNTIVNAISHFPFTLSGTENLSLSYVLPVSLLGFIKGASEVMAAEGTGLGFVGAAIIGLLVFVSLVPLAKLVIWWYLRLFKMFVYTAISPLMFASLAFPKFNKTGKGFIKSVVAESFSQTFVAIGLLVFSAFLSQIPAIMSQSQLGLVGLGLALYVGLKFLEDLPSMAYSLIQSGSTGSAGSGASSGVLKGAAMATPLALARGAAHGGAKGYSKGAAGVQKYKERQVKKAQEQKKAGGGSNAAAKSKRK